jgi:hypothetical protein
MGRIYRGSALKANIFHINIASTVILSVAKDLRLYPYYPEILRYAQDDNRKGAKVKPFFTSAN